MFTLRRINLAEADLVLITPIDDEFNGVTISHANNSAREFCCSGWGAYPGKTRQNTGKKEPGPNKI